MRFVHIIGENKVGKTTLAKPLNYYINAHTKYCSNVLAFADGVRDELIKYYDIPASLAYDKVINKNKCILNLGDYHYEREIEALWQEFGIIPKGQSFKDTTVNFRELFINHATLVRRRQDPDYWTKIFHKKVDELRVTKSIDIIITDDVRHGNEIDSCDSVHTHNPVFWLENDLDQPSDITQEVIKKWYSENKDRCVAIHVPVPLDTKTCTRIIIDEIFPVLNI